MPPHALAPLDEAVRLYLTGGRDEYFNLLLLATLIVAIGVVLEGFEVCHEVKDEISRYRFKFRHELRIDGTTGLPVFEHRLNRKLLAAAVGWFLVSIGVVGEFWLEAKVKQFDVSIQFIDNDLSLQTKLEIARANERAANANSEAGEARKEAEGFKAQIAASDARAKHAEAQVASAKAGSDAASTKAEGFRLDIAKAQESASIAQARAAEANLELARIKLPRSLINVPELVSSLRAFAETEYTFASVFQDLESIEFLKSIDDVLQRAGWKRGKPTNGFPAINVYGAERELSVPAGLNTGVRMSVDSLEPLKVLQSLPSEALPQLVKASIALRNGLLIHTVPGGGSEPSLVDVLTGASNTVRIFVGKKP
jgi:hypothetical protein